MTLPDSVRSETSKRSMRSSRWIRVTAAAQGTTTDRKINSEIERSRRHEKAWGGIGRRCGRAGIDACADSGSSEAAATYRAVQSWVLDWRCLVNAMKLTRQLKMRPYRDWPSCDGKPRPAKVPGW